VEPRIAYFSMEAALDPAIPTYSGGLGVLAGDFLRSSADAELPMVAVSLVYRQGYFRQKLDRNGKQTESADAWEPSSRCERVDTIVTLTLFGRPVRIRAWRYDVKGVTGGTIPVYLLDTNLPENHPDDRVLTDRLYGGDATYRLAQEAVLGLGGERMLEALGYDGIDSYHLNEGHAALLIVGLLEKHLRDRDVEPIEADEEDLAAVRDCCVFTTHTPVPAGHDRFMVDLVHKVLGERRLHLIGSINGLHDGQLNMTYLALQGSRYINGVAMRHGEVSQDMFPNYPIHAITNGVHAGTWTSRVFADLFDRHVPAWRRDNYYLRYAIGIPLEEIRDAHIAAKALLLAEIENRTGVKFDSTVFTIGFARRAATYKRAHLFLEDPQRLRDIAAKVGKFQIVYAGKAHPQDEAGKAEIARVVAEASQLGDAVRFAYLENYDLTLGALMTAGVDLWLNTPQPPMEASGTSGMKAALNGVPSFSILDGWWIEGHVEGVTGWSLEDGDMYDKLETQILPRFYQRGDDYIEMMRSTIALNGSFFNTQRMVAQYAMNAYFLTEEEALEPSRVSVGSIT
jgi:glycogen phosphorylase